MNLHGIVAPIIGAVNPLIPVTIRRSSGQSGPSVDGVYDPTFATPGTFTGAISGGVLTVSAVASGSLAPGQTVSGADVVSGTEIVEQLSGTAGGAGTYRLNRTQDDAVVSEPMTTAYTMQAQVQPMTWRDLQQTDGLNMNGTRRKIYLYGSIDSVNRVARGGGDLIEIDVGGPNDGVWLVAQVLEQFPEWVSAACTLQNED